MTKLEALQQLAEKVEAGERKNDGTMFKLFGDNWTACFDAFGGSLDAALSLHNAVLPGSVVRGVWDYRAHVSISTGKSETHALAKCPARAWLLAILRALIAIEQQNRDSGDQL